MWSQYESNPGPILNCCDKLEVGALITRQRYFNKDRFDEVLGKRKHFTSRATRLRFRRKAKLKIDGDLHFVQIWRRSYEKFPRV